MFTNGALVYKLSEVKRTSELSKFIRRYRAALPNQIYNSVQNQIKKMSEVYWDYDIIDTLYLTPVEIRDCDWSLLMTYVNAINNLMTTSAMSIHNDENDRCAMVATLLALDINHSSAASWLKMNDNCAILFSDLVIELLGFIYPCEPSWDTYYNIINQIPVDEFWNNWRKFDWLQENIPNQELLIGLLQYAEIQNNYKVRMDFLMGYHHVYMKTELLEIRLAKFFQTLSYEGHFYRQDGTYIFENEDDLQMWALMICDSLMNGYDFDKVFLSLIEEKRIFDEKDYSEIRLFIHGIIHVLLDYHEGDKNITTWYTRAKTLLETISVESAWSKINQKKETESYESWLAHEEATAATEAYSKLSTTMQQASQKIYNGYKAYKQKEDVVDSQLTKMMKAAKRAFVGDTKKAVIEGKEFTALGLLKSALRTAAIFSFGPIKGLILFVIQRTLRKNSTRAERKKVLMELEEELEIINEKIDDAKGDGNRQAKYAMMRTRAELQNAIKRIRYGIEADERSTSTAKKVLASARDETGGEG